MSTVIEVTAPATITRPVSDTFAELPTADMLAVALAAVSVATDTDDAARATLAEIVRARYVFHSDALAYTVHGVRVLPANLTKEVTGRLWLDAIGRITPPKGTERTPGERSLGLYLSRYGVVATDLALGLAKLDSVKSANDAYKAHGDAARAAKAKAELAQADSDAIGDKVAFREWLTAQPAKLQTSYADVISSLRHAGAPHFHGFAVVVTEPTDTK